MSAGEIDMLATPITGHRPPPGATWAADNGCFGKGYPGDDAWLAWLAKFTAEERTRCLFAVAPDVVGDAVATQERAAPFLATVRGLGFPVAYVAQDGLENLGVPWDEFDALFIGGTTEWKLGTAARDLVRQARTRGKWVHMGRVNSQRRLLYAQAIGCQSADGTFLVFGPDVNLPRVLTWLSAAAQPALFDLWEETVTVTHECDRCQGGGHGPDGRDCPWCRGVGVVRGSRS